MPFLHCVRFPQLTLGQSALVVQDAGQFDGAAGAWQMPFLHRVRFPHLALGQSVLLEQVDGQIFGRIRGASVFSPPPAEKVPTIRISPAAASINAF